MKNIAFIFNYALNQDTAQVFVPEVQELSFHSKRQGGVNILPFLRQREASDYSALLFDPWRSYMMLDGYISTVYQELGSCTSYEKYKALPKNNRMEKLFSEVYRILRVYHMAFIHENGIIERESSMLWHVDMVTNPTVYSFRITDIGLNLLTSFVSYYFYSVNSIEPIPYIEAILSSMYGDIIDQIVDFHDEDADLRLFHSPLYLNRHFRYANGNATFAQEDGVLYFEKDVIYNDCGRFPIDFYFYYGNDLYIVPNEVMDSNKISINDISKWKARVDKGRYK
jgi:hypothetical protein